MKRLVLLSVVAAVATLAAGCGVSRQVVEEKDAALRTCQQSLQACQAELDTRTERFLAAQSELEACQKEAETKLGECGRELTQARADLAAANRELAEARRVAEEARRQAEELKQREDQLRARLQQELQDKTVEIENLRGRLSVRVLDKILFRSGSAAILTEGQAVLDKLGAVLKDATEMVRVEGHTDDVPIGPGLKDKYFSNWELSAARASSVVRYFQFAHELGPQRMEAVGLSMYRPVATNDTPEGRQKNRRVEIVLTAAK